MAPRSKARLRLRGSLLALTGDDVGIGVVAGDFVEDGEAVDARHFQVVG